MKVEKEQPNSDRATGVPGAVVTLTDGNGVVLATATTNENGEYRFGLTGAVRMGAMVEPEPMPPLVDDDRREPAPASSHRDDDDDAPTGSRRGRTVVVTVVVAGLIVGAGGFAWVSGWFDGFTGTAAASDSATTEPPPVTAEVTERTLTETRELEGTLSHGDASTVTTSGQGIVTGVAEQGTAVKSGSTLYRLNEQPVTGMYGTVPMYRDQQTGASGTDVKQLETNLADLGYDGFTVDNDFTEETADAVRQWQGDLGREETGVVLQGDVVFVPEGSRIDTIHAGVGSRVAPGTAVLDLTGSDHVVSGEVEVADRELLTVGTAVSVLLPGGHEVPGTVTAANVVAVEPEDSGMGGEESAGADDSITEVEVTLKERVDESLLGAPADVVVEVDERADVLAVPVTALLALSDGGHGVEVVADDNTTDVVPVETGLFADGMVEISGAGIEQGTVVGVAGR